MRILQVHNRYRLPGGEDSIVEAEADLLEAAGHEVERLRVSNPAASTRAVAAMALAPWNPRQAQRVRQIVRARRPDIAHVHNTWFALSPAVADALRGEGVPVVLTLQNYRLLCVNSHLFRDGRVCTDCVGTHPWRGVLHRCYRGSTPQSVVAAATIALARRRSTWERVSRFLVPSQSVRDVFVAAGLDADRITVKPNVVADPGMRPAPPSASQELIFAGRLSAEKGVAILLDAWSKARAHVPNLRLRVIGDGPLRRTLEATAPAGVRFSGWLAPEALAARLLQARALLFPTQWLENFGRVVVEAMAAGLPVVTSDIGTPAEIIRTLGSRWLVPPADSDAWADAMAGLVDDAAVDRAGIAARALYEAQYTLDRGLRDLVGVYSSVLVDPR